MDQLIYNLCLLYSNDSTYFGVVGLQIDNTLLLANGVFVDREESELYKA